MAIWGCVFHFGPHCLCLCLGKQCCFSAQTAAAAASVAGHGRCHHGKLNLLRHGLMVGNQSRQVQGLMFHMQNYTTSTMWSSGWFRQMFSCDLKWHFVFYCQVFYVIYYSGNWNLYKWAHWEYTNSSINHMLYEELLQITSWCQCVDYPKTTHILIEWYFYAP